MKHFRLSLLACFWLASAIYAADIDGPSEVEGQQTIKLKAKDAGPKTGIVWKLKALDGQDLAKIEWLSGTSRKTKEIHWIGPLGRYEVQLTTLAIVDGVPEFDQVERVVTLGKGGPVPPPPDDPLVKALQDAYATDTDADKAKHVKALAALYRQAAKMDLSTEATAGDLQTTLRKAAAQLLPATALDKTRAAVAVELKKVLPATPGEPLTVDTRRAAQALFAKLALALEVL